MVHRSIRWLQLICRFCDELCAFADTLDTTNVVDLNNEHINNQSIHCNELRQACLELQTMERPDTLDLQCTELVRDTCVKVQTCFRLVMTQPEINTFRPSEPELFFQRALGVALSLSVEYYQIADNTLYRNCRQHPTNLAETDRPWMLPLNPIMEVPEFMATATMLR
jgi:hypothetical protein